MRNKETEPMIRNYILTALRNLWRNKLVTLINLMGMAVGFGLFLSFWNWSRYDLSYDRFHEEIDRLYILKARLTMNGSEYDADRVGGIFGPVLPQLFPQVSSSCRIFQPLDFELGVPDEGGEGNLRYFHEEEVMAVDSTFFDLFSFRLLQGSRGEVFTAPDHIVITESLSRKLFGDSTVLGRSIRIGEGDIFTVAGVAEDPPENSSYQFRVLIGFPVMGKMGYPVDGYGGTIYYSNFKLQEGTDLDALNVKINEHVRENFDSDFDAWFYLDPLSRLHLWGESRSYIGLYVNIIMAIVILSVACINFINLTTAYSSGRLKEITIRKSVGASKRQLVTQFMTETYLILLIAFYLGFFLAEQLGPALSRSFDLYIPFALSGFRFWMQVLGIYLVTGLLAGLYPAVKIAGFRPVAFLQGMSCSRYKGGSRSRKVLTVIQFAFSVFFIVITIFTMRQFVYLREADLGFNRDHVLYIPTRGKVWEDYPEIKQELGRLSFVKGITSGSQIPVMINSGDVDWGEREGEHNQVAMVVRTDADFLSTFQIALQEGRYYATGSDSLNRTYVVVNRALVDLLGWEDPVGRSFYLWGEDRTILGVTENIHFFPFNLEAFGNHALIYLYEPVLNYVFIRVAPGTSSEQIAAIGDIFEEYNPGYEIAYDFISNYSYEALENSDGIILIFKIFSILTIFIAVIGLVGLSLYNNSRRTKEVGIRKAMGAHSGIITRLLLSEFMRLVVLSNLVALPLAYLVMRRILQFFNYSVDMQVQVYALVFLLSLVVSLLTVLIQACRTARMNPVESLRYE